MAVRAQHLVALVAVVALAVVSCGDSNPCAVAAARLEPCQAELDQIVPHFPLPSRTSECSSEESRCVAACVLQSTCPFVVEAARTTQVTDPNAPPVSEGAGAFLDCTIACFT